jgi:large subunit ribosomal protein L17
MRHRKRIDKLSRPADHRKAMLRNIVTSLFERYSVQTTVSKAKAARKVADRLITYSISGTLADKRRIISYIKNRDVAHKVIKLGQDNFSNRSPGGYTAVYNIGWRKGDGAKIVLLQLLVEEIEGKKRKKRAKGKIEHEVIEVTKRKKRKKFVMKKPRRL